MDATVQTGTRSSIHPATRVGFVELTVNDLDRALAFYRQALGLELIWQDERQAGLGAGGRVFLRLTGDPQAERPRRATGLYHLAVLLPSRQALGRSLHRLATGKAGLQGAADHWFSEAIYLSDPEGNGIELYRDRPRPEWPPMEQVARMGNGHFDLRRLLDEVERPPAPGETIDAETTLGHIHLRVNDVASADVFYSGVLGFDPMMHFGASAGFVSAGGYHHHIAYNVWESAGAPPAPAGAAGLRFFGVVLPDAAARQAVLARLEQAGLPVEEAPDGPAVRDPAGNLLALTIAGA